MINLFSFHDNYSRFMIVNVKSDCSLHRRFCNYKNASLRDTDVDDSLSVQLYGKQKSDNRWYLLDSYYDVSCELDDFLISNNQPIKWTKLKK